MILGTFLLEKLDIKNEKSTMIDLYIETCDRHKDFRECDDFSLI